MAKTAAKKTAKKKTAAKAEETKKNKTMIAGIVSVVVIIGVVLLVMNAGGMAKRAIEKVASHTLGVPVHIASLDISLQEKQVVVGGLKISNPEGYKNAHALTIETIDIAASDITKELLSFNNIIVSGTDLYLEVTENGTNFTDLRKKVDTKASAEEKAAGDPAKVIIDLLRIENARVHPSVTLAGGDMQTMTLRDIELRNIGRKSNGVLASEAIGEVLDEVVQVATEASMEQGFLKGLSSESMEDLGLSSGLFDKVRGIFGN